MMTSCKQEPLDFSVKALQSASADSRNAVTPPSTLPNAGMSMMSPLLLGGGVQGVPGLDPFTLQQMLMGLTHQGQAQLPGSDPSVTISALNAINRRKRRAINNHNSNESTPTKRVCNEESLSDSSTTPNKRPDSSASSTNTNHNGTKMEKDDAYWERRRRNNEAAKRSRDARRNKEEDVARRAAYLEQENLQLRAQVTILKNETAKLHFLLLSNAAQQKNKGESQGQLADTTTNAHLSPPLSTD